MKYIAISREYGSGGRAIGQGIAAALGLTLYDRDIIRGVAAESGQDYQYLAENAELVTKAESFIRNITPMGYDQKDTLFDLQKEIILDFAKKGPCVVLGRCGGPILEEAGYDVFNVFLHANESFRSVSIGEYLGTSDQKLIHKTLQKIDSRRIAYYERYTGLKWGNYRNYDLMLDTGRLGSDECIRIICEAVKSEGDK